MDFNQLVPMIYDIVAQLDTRIDDFKREVRLLNCAIGKLERDRHQLCKRLFEPFPVWMLVVIQQDEPMYTIYDLSESQAQNLATTAEAESFDIATWIKLQSDQAPGVETEGEFYPRLALMA